MKVSVITPSYQQAAFLARTIQSVLGQNYPDLEYLVVDGGSTDSSRAIIEKYAGQLAWWVSEPDGGQAEAINKGFRRATGEIVAWLNSDDMYAPGAIQAAVDYFTAHPEIGLVYGDALSFDETGHPLNDLTFAPWGLADLAAFNIICQPAVFMRRDVLAQTGLLDDSYHMLLDHHLWLRIAQETKIAYVPALWAFARHHAAAKNVAQAPKFGEEAFKLLAWMRTQPRLAAIVSQNERRVLAMAHRFNARYLLDGGMAWASLRAYARSFGQNPAICLQEWHRVIFALLSLVGLKKLGTLYYRIQKQNLPKSLEKLGQKNIHDLYQNPKK